MPTLDTEELRRIAREEYMSAVRTLPKDRRPWPEIAREHQIEPEDAYFIWFLCCGRGAGKTRTGAETVNKWANELPGSYGLLVGRSAADVRSVMLEGESGLLRLYPYLQDGYEPSKRRLTWPNGTVAECLYAESPDTLRGPQGHWAWGDEIAAWEDAKLGDKVGTAFNNLVLATRLGKDRGWRPRMILTSTPKPVQLVVDLVDRPGVITRTWSTYDNIDNLADEFIAEIRNKYENTRIAAQEVYGQLLLQAANALWSNDIIDSLREGKWDDVESKPELTKICVGWDPAVTDGEDSDEHGIVVCALDKDSKARVLADHSAKMSPDKAAKLVTKLYSQWNANAVIFEKNQGGDFIPALLRSVGNVPNIGVHARHGKRLRAEPIAARYEQGRVIHHGVFPKLEEQMTRWDPEDPKSKSPDRVDALVYALQWLFEGEGGQARLIQRVGFRRR